MEQPGPGTADELPRAVEPLNPDHLVAPVEVAAPALLGATITVGDRRARIVEVEAYGGADDAASHAFRGVRPRNRTMFGPPGRLYVYRSYGIHACANVVTGQDGTGSAVLIRAVAPLEGIEQMRSARPAARRDVELTSGPGRLCQALGITLDHDGADLFDPASPVRLEGPAGPNGEVAVSGRVGITREVDRPWRFWLAGDPYVSRHRAGAARRSAR